MHSEAQPRTFEALLKLAMSNESFLPKQSSYVGKELERLFAYIQVQTMVIRMIDDQQSINNRLKNLAATARSIDSEILRSKVIEYIHLHIGDNTYQGQFEIELAPRVKKWTVDYQVMLSIAALLLIALTISSWVYLRSNGTNQPMVVENSGNQLPTTPSTNIDDGGTLIAMSHDISRSEGAMSSTTIDFHSQDRVSVETEITTSLEKGWLINLNNSDNAQITSKFAMDGKIHLEDKFVADSRDSWEFFFTIVAMKEASVQLEESPEWLLDLRDELMQLNPQKIRDTSLVNSIVERHLRQAGYSGPLSVASKLLRHHAVPK